MITPLVLLYVREPSPPASVTEIASLARAEVNQRFVAETGSAILSVVTVRVPPKETDVPLIVIELLVNDAFPIFDSVFEPPLIVLLLRVEVLLSVNAEVLVKSAFAISVPPAVVPSCTTRVFLVVFTETSPSAPVKALF